MRNFIYILFLAIFLIIDIEGAHAQAECGCNSFTDDWVVNLSSKADTTWTITGMPKRDENGSMCNGHVKCWLFYVTLNPQTNLLTLDYTKHGNGGAFYVTGIGVDTMIEPSQNLCIPGVGPFCISFCKPGGDGVNDFITIKAAHTVEASPDAVTSNGCEAEVWAKGLKESTIIWNVVYPNSTYNTYLSTTSGSDTIRISPPPDYKTVKYFDVEISGTADNICKTVNSKDTVRVNFVTNKSVTIIPTNPAICFGGATATLTAEVANGFRPYTYKWYNMAGTLISTDTFLNVGTIGDYKVIVQDATTCPPFEDTVTVIQYTLPIAALAGNDTFACSNSASIMLNGSVVTADGAFWSGGNGTFFPDSSALNAVYAPTAAEIMAGEVELYLTTSGNGGCSAEKDTVLVSIYSESAKNISATACNSYIFGGNTYTVSGVYTDTLVNFRGCDSIIALNLTIVPPSFLTINQTICNSFTYNGTTYTASGIYKDTLQNAAGCDSIITINLTIKNSSTSTITQTSCDNYTLNGTTYTVSGTYSQTIVNADGCDSVITLNLTIVSTLNASVSISPSTNNVCEGVSVTYTATPVNGGLAPQYQWYVNGVLDALATGATYNYLPADADVVKCLLTSSLTCVSGSPATSNSLTMMVYAKDLTQIISICQGDTYTLPSGTIVNTSGTYIDSLINSKGCDSIITTILTVGTDLPVSIAISASKNPFCSGSEVTFTAVPTNGGFVPVYQWIVNSTNVGINSNTYKYIPLQSDVVKCSLTSSLICVTGSPAESNSLTLNEILPDTAVVDTAICPGNWYTLPDGTLVNTVNSYTTTILSSQNCDSVVITNLSFIPLPTATAGADDSTCYNLPYTLSLASTTNVASVLWSHNGAGILLGSNSLNPEYYPSITEVGSTVQLEIKAFGIGNCTSVTDIMNLKITGYASIEAGPDQVACANNSKIALTATQLGSGKIKWQSGGDGSFSPSDSVLNVFYLAGPNDISTGNAIINLDLTSSCGILHDNLTVTYTPTPSVNAGVDITECSNITSVKLTGLISGGASTGIWKSTTSGSFNPSGSSLVTYYYPTTSDTSAGKATLVLASTNNGTCLAVTDTCLIQFIDEPVVSITAADTVCGGSAVNLSLSLFGGTGKGKWTSNGTGSFAPHDSALLVTYNPSLADKLLNVLSFTFNIKPDAYCLPVMPLKNVVNLANPIINAGADQSVCSNNATINLSAVITQGATRGIWTSSGTGIFSPSDTARNSSYVPSALDTALHAAVLTYTSTDGCIVASDALNLDIYAAPKVNAGGTVYLCKGITSLILNGKITGFTSAGVWKTLGNGTFNNANLSTATYTFGNTDTTISGVKLVLTSSNNLGCNAVTDTLKVFFTTIPIVNAGVGGTICSNDSFHVNGTITGTFGSGIWKSDGGGYFSPSDTALNAYYVPSASDILKAFVTLILTSTKACSNSSSVIQVVVTEGPIVNAGSNFATCESDISIPITASGTAWAFPVNWIISGDGTIAPNASSTSIFYTPGANDKLLGEASLIVSTTQNGACFPAKDTITIFLEKSPTSTAGFDINICKGETAPLSGTFTGGNGRVKWTTSGDGTFSPSDTLANSSYIPGANDIIAGMAWLQFNSSIGGKCAPAVSSLKVNLLPSAYAIAGTDETVCSNNALITLNGSVVNATGGLWSASGAGSFSPSATSLAAVYTASAIDISSSIFNIILSTTGGSCLSVSDTLAVSVLQKPVVSAGEDIFVCYGTQVVTISGTISGTTQKGIWKTLGDGSFLDKDTILNNIYKLGMADIAANSVKLVLESRNNGLCNVVRDTVLIQLTGIPTVFAGNNLTVCANNGNILLNGQISGPPGTGVWSTIGGTGNFSPSADSLESIYIPSPDDTAMHNMRLVLTSTKVCVPVTDTLTVTFTPAPKVNAGTDISVCNSSLSVTLNGQISGGASGGIWNSLAGGSFSPSTSALNSVYSFSATDKVNGSVLLTLTSTGNGLCNAVTDSINISFIAPAITVLNIPDTACVGSLVAMNAAITGGSGKGKWQSAGSGTFAPNDSSLIVSYNPSVAENTGGLATISFKTTSDGYCIPIIQSKTIVLTPLPVLDAGADQIVCANNATVALKATISAGATKGKWTSIGTGIFSPSDTSLITNYIPSALDTANHLVKLYFSTSQACSDVIDSLKISITSAPVVDAGSTVYVCRGEVLAQLNGSVLGTGFKGSWKTLGSGFFTNPVDLKAVYVMSTADTSAGRVELVFTSTNNGKCVAVTDTVEVVVTDIPAVSVSIDQTLCANDTAIVSGTISNNTLGRWTSSGKGYFIPTDTSKNAAYVPLLADTALTPLKIKFTAIESCVNVSDSLLLTIRPTPYINAGIDKKVCENNALVNLAASGSSWAYPVEWNTLGNGTFSPNNQMLNPAYTAGINDKTIGSVKLVVATTQNAGCNAARDTVNVEIVKIPVTEAGNLQTVCAGKNVVLQGQITGGNGRGKWNKGSGDGFFGSVDTLLNNSYLPGANDKSNGYVWLYLNAISDGTCVGSIDSVKIIILPAPTANAGANTSVCSNSGLVSLSGTISNATGGIWSSPGGGVFSPSNVSLNPTYQATTAELLLSKFPIILTSTGNGSCLASIDTVLVTVTPAPKVNAGIDKYVCESTSTVDIAGIVTGVTSKGKWKSLGDGSFLAADTLLSNWYKFGSADIAAKKVFLVLESRNNGGCNVVSDTIMIGITTVPTVNAGIDQTVCANNATIDLNGAVTGGSGTGLWSSPNGAGIFSPTNNGLTCNYIPAISDTSKKKIYIVLTASASCVDVTDTLVLNISPAPHVDAGLDQYFCSSVSNVTLTGSVSSGASTGIWSTSGLGTILSNTSTNTSYTVVPADISADSIRFVLASTNNGNCLVEYDTSIIYFKSTPTADFVTNQFICRKTQTAFSDSSHVPYGKVISRLWTIEGKTFTDSTVLYSFLTNGARTIQFDITTDKGCSNSVSKSITVRDLPVSDFMSSPNCSNSQVLFEASSATAVQWFWNFGNGETATGKKPAAQTYTSSGDKNIQLISNDIYTCTDTFSRMVKIYENPNALYTFDNICHGSQTRFRDRSTILGDVITRWHWNFGDGDTSNVKNPNHVYMTLQDTVKIMMVALTAHCADTLIQAQCVKGFPKINASATEGCTPLSVTFSSDQPAESYFLWKFGDGFTSSQMSPTHQFHNSDDTSRTYEVKLIVETVDGCVDSTSLNITVKPKPKTSFAIPKDKVCSADSLSFTNTSTGANNYKWYVNHVYKSADSIVKFSFNNSTSITQYQPLSLITYSNNGCSDSIVKYITVYGIPVNNIAFGKDTVCNNESVKISAASGGSLYAWNYGDGISENGGAIIYHSFPNNGAADTAYKVALHYKSLESCSNTFFDTIVVRPTPAVSFSYDTLTGCTPLKLNLVNNTPGTISEKWYFSDGDSAVLSSVSHTFINPNLTQSSYNAKLVITNLFGCKGSKEETFNVYPQPVAAFTSDTAGCSPFNISFKNESVNAASYAWDFGNNNTSSNETPKHTYINDKNFVETNYASLIAISSFGCRDTARYNNIKVYPGPDGYFSVANSGGCSPFMAEFTNQSVGANQYKWIFGDTDTIESLSTTINHRFRNVSNSLMKYTVKLVPTNEFSCPDTVEQTIEVYPAVASSFKADSFGCSPYTLKFNNTSLGAKFFDWQFGDGNTSSTENPEHTYTNLENAVKVFNSKLITISDYLCTDTAELNIRIYPKPKATFFINPNSGCTPFNSTLTDSTKHALSYFWDYGDGATDTTDVFVRNHTYLNAEAGIRTYDLKLIVKSEGNCSDTLSHTVTVYPEVKAAFNVNKSADCSPLSVLFDNTSDKVFKYLWDFGDGALSGLEKPSHTFINTSVKDTSYETQLLIESHYGCTDTAKLTMQVYARPPAEFTAEPSYQVMPNATVSVKNSTIGNWQYHWDFGDNITSELEEPTSHTYTKWGSFIITLKAYNNLCSDTASHPVIIATGKPIAAYDSDSAFSGCVPHTMTFKNLSIGADNYKWYFGDGGASEDSIPTYTYNQAGVYTVELSALSPAGETVANDKVVTVYAKPKPYFQVSPLVVEAYKEMKCLNITNNGARYVWNFGDNSTSEEIDPIHIYTAEGKYNVTLYAWSEHECFDSLELKDAIKVEPGCGILFPNAFTPNKYGPSGGKYNIEEKETTNDIFHPITKNITGYELEIFNRWGELLFISNDLSIGWDGYFKNVLVKDDVYIWKVKATCFNGKEIVKTGTVVVVR